MEKFFYPERVAVIGVSESPSNLGKIILKNMRDFHFSGRYYPVGVNGGTVFGHDIHRSVMDIPDEIDLAMILVRADRVPEVALRCGRKGIRRLVIGTAGFAETGPDGAALEKQLMEIREQYDMRIVGPNCMGLCNMANGLFLPFSFEEPDFISKGPVSIIGQSGTITMDYARQLSRNGLGISKIASIGNKMDADEVDFLEHFLNDEETRIVFLYLESFSRGREFLRLAAEARKPVIVHKANVSEQSRQVAMSHTHSLAADDKIVDAMLRQAGVIRINDLEEFLDCVRVLALPRLKGNRFAILSPGGGVNLCAADACHENGFVLSCLPSDYISWLKQRGRTGVIPIMNPIDLSDEYDFEIYPEMFSKLLEVPEVDGILYDVGHTPLPWRMSIYPKWFRRLSGICRASEKPVYIRMPVYDSPTMPEIRESLSVPFFQSTPRLFESAKKVMKADRGKWDAEDPPVPVHERENK